MCGIFGYVGQVAPEYSEIFHKLLTNLFWFSEERGTHASGFAAVLPNGNVVADKMPVKGSTFTEFSKPFQDLSKELPISFIAHTRYGTCSNPMVNNNNHPFFGQNFHMVHNGTIQAWQTYVKEHALIESMTSETDSEVILRLFEKRRNWGAANGEPFKISVEWLLDTLWGNMAVALLDLNEKGNIWLFRNDNPLVVVDIPEGVFGPSRIVMFCSTYKIFNGAWEYSYKQPLSEWKAINWTVLLENQLYKLSAVGELSNENIHKHFLIYRINPKRRFYRQLNTWNDGYRYGPHYHGSSYGSTPATVPLDGPRNISLVETGYSAKEVIKKDFYSYSIRWNNGPYELCLADADKAEIRKLADQPKVVNDEVRVDGIPVTQYMRFNSACINMVKYDELIRTNGVAV